MNPVLAVVLTVLLGSSMYLAGRLHARVGYRFGYRYGYRQGYFDGDRACWNRIRREGQIGGAYAIEAAVEAPPAPSAPRPRTVTGGQPDSFSDMPGERGRADFVEVPGTTYASTASLGRHAQDGFVSG